MNLGHGKMAKLNLNLGSLASESVLLTTSLPERFPLGLPPTNSHHISKDIFSLAKSPEPWLHHQGLHSALSWLLCILAG